MSDALVRAAFETRVASWAASQVPPMQVAYQNKAFDPPPGTYVRCWVLPNPTQCLAMDGSHRERRGVFQVDLCMPMNIGSTSVQSLLASLDAAFPLSAPLQQGGISVFLLTPMSGATGRPDGTHYVVPVSCIYDCHTAA